MSYPDSETPIRYLHTNAVIWTADTDHPTATSMLVHDGAITAIDPEPEHLTGDEQIVDHGGAFLMPGFGDVHNHHLLAGRASLVELQLDGNADLDAVLDSIAAWSEHLDEDAWVVGGGWGSHLLDAVSSLDALHRLDHASGGRAVMLRDDSCHNRWVSTRTMSLAGLGADTEDPDGGRIARDATSSRPVGVLIEAALIPVERAYAATHADTTDLDAASCAHAIETLHSFGVTHFQDAAASLPMMQALASLDRRGELRAWVVTSAQINDKIFGTSPIGMPLLDAAGQYRTEHHRPSFVKIFLDGVPTSRTALLLEPYLPDGGENDDWFGQSTMTQTELTEWLLEVARRGLGAKVHCTGDGSVRMVLDATAVLRERGHTDTVIQIAHGEYIADDDLPRMATLDIVADLSPPLWFPGVILEAICRCIPRDRARRMCPNRTLLDLGVVMAGGSDWPVMPSPNPWIGIQGLVTRADPSGAHPGTLWPEQALTLEEALRIYTIGVAQATGLAAVTGSLAEGKSADFTVLNRNPFAVASTELVTITSRQTWFAGRQVFSDRH
ncbi:amidohydrolase [Rhodococcus erythropolis]|uniref:amidohydrolase n=1 Tax=Rhodococcus erythropolis TaxID=1833 RepID=UPI000878D4C3|nr:amidohydrolase [Rhodococcus erythropolis]OFV78625.1 N-substituted formamide deformylase precursor [Rhodococcus erythropolis]